MKEALEGDKRTDAMSTADIQQGNAAWWSTRPMTYDWDGENRLVHGTLPWFDHIDRIMIDSHSLFATDSTPFDRMIPLASLKGKRVLEIGCGMGFHTETMARAGALVTAVDLTEPACETTRQRLRLKGLDAQVLQADAEDLPFPEASFDFVWSWGVIHHSARTARIVRNIARVLTSDGECRVMVYNRASLSALTGLFRNHILNGGFLTQSVEESLFRSTDGFSARFYIREQFEDLFRAFFSEVESELCGLGVDIVPLPRQLRELTLSLLPGSYQRSALARRGGFIFLKARKPT